MSGQRVFFMGIGGTGMAAVAGLLKKAGFEVIGSDKPLYPPMSTMLQRLDIEVLSPFSSDNIRKVNPDLIVVGNVISAHHEEAQYMLENKIPYTSFPAVLGEKILNKYKTIVVTGTHGKTTTTSLISHCLEYLGISRNYMIGGIPKGKDRGFDLGGGDYFVIEGDEYDTAFFDKGPKFLHYKPYHLVINNIEFDHADIFRDVDHIKEQFKKVSALVTDPARIVAFQDDENVRNIVDGASFVSFKNSKADIFIESYKASLRGWQLNVKSKSLGRLEITTQLSGRHNMANIGHALGILQNLVIHDGLSLAAAKVVAAIESFAGVRRRMDFLGMYNGAQIYEDFAHHPTAIATVIDGMRSQYPNHRLVVAFEPANATGRRNVFQDQFADSLGKADVVFIAPPPEDLRIDPKDRMDVFAMAKSVKSIPAQAFGDHDTLYRTLKAEIKDGDIVVFMSPSSFQGVQHKLCQNGA